MIERVTVFGVGAVGGYFGGVIARAFAEADDGREVYFVARGEHLREIQRQGLILNTPEEAGLICKPTKATDDFADLPPADLILLCVKGCDIPGAAKAIAKNCKKDTYIIPLLNGIDVYERIREHLDTGIVFPTCIYIASSRELPGTVTKIGGPLMVHLGKDLRYMDALPQDLLVFFDEMGFPYEWHEDALPAIWEKFMFVAPFALYSARTGQNFGEMMADENARQEVRAIMEEVYALSKAANISLPETIVEDSLAKAYTFPPETRTSFEKDLTRKAKNNEGDLFGGTILRLGRQHNIPTPKTTHYYP